MNCVPILVVLLQCFGCASVQNMTNNSNAAADSIDIVKIMLLAQRRAHSTKNVIVDSILPIRMCLFFS